MFKWLMRLRQFSFILFIFFAVLPIGERFLHAGPVEARESSKTIIARNIQEAIQSLELEVDYARLFQLQMQLFELRDADPALPRSQKLELYAFFLSGLEKFLERHPQVEGNQEANVSLPPGVAGFSGIAADAIKDPQKRNDYIARDVENRERIRNASNQHLVTKMRGELRVDAAEFCARAYGKSAMEEQALREDLKGFKDIAEFLTMVSSRR